MREILFRGKDIKGNWHIGLLAHIGNAWYISNKAGVSTAFEVRPETVGQYTGLTDKNGTKIFEGDKCRITRHCILCYGSITFKKGSFWFEEFNTDSVIELNRLKPNNFEIEVIGNIHDNPEILEG